MTTYFCLTVTLLQCHPTIKHYRDIGLAEKVYLNKPVKTQITFCREYANQQRCSYDVVMQMSVKVSKSWTCYCGDASAEERKKEKDRDFFILYSTLARYIRSLRSSSAL
jgi:hypothetical protein